ncbi:MAG: FAD-binding protein, partial [Bacteroidetes bacterium]|nr:FAD-binding protein [Bacteroidota bacterium]
MQTIQLSLSPVQASTEENIQQEVANHLNIAKEQITEIRLLKRSIDARKRKVKVQLKIEVYINEKAPNFDIERNYQDVSSKDPVVIVGSGPAGLFAALKLIELGKKPIVLERGKDVQSRRRDLAAINKEHIVNPNSNYCFGEGGAGTYSDGKLYTRSKKRGSIQSVLETMVFHGAKEDILIDAHPHIGTNKLPKLIADIRETILNAGGEIHFNTKVTDFIIEKNTIKGVVTESDEKIEGTAVILATGHSARDIFFLLQEKGIAIEGKSFAMGVRIEHPQALIDQIQYSCTERSPYLPAAS